MDEETPSKKSRRSEPPRIELQFGSAKIRLEQTLSVVAAFLGLVVGITAFTLGSRSIEAGKQVADNTGSVVERSIDQSKKEMEAILNQQVNSQIDSQLAKIAKFSPDAAAAAHMASVEKSVGDLDFRMDRLEQVILQDPAKALEIPLLRNQMESLKESEQSDLVSVHQEIAQVYDLNKWFIGLMFTMALGIIGLAITNFIKVGKKGGD